MADTFFNKRFSDSELRALADKRRRYMGLPSGPGSNILYLAAIAFSVLVIVPAYFSFILPITAVYALIFLLPKHLSRSSSKSLLSSANGEAQSEVHVDLASVPPLASREYDVVVFGVTGLCGKVTAEYLLVQHFSKGDFKIAFAGRSLSKLQAARAELSSRTGVPGAENVPLIEADSSDWEALVAMTRTTRVVATTVGPYKKYGELLVKACAYTGTGYCDLTGEPDFVSGMARKYDAVAKATGARIVHLTGVDSVPSEIMTTLAATTFKAQFGHAPTRVEHVLMGAAAGVPGGTVDTVIATINGESAPSPKSGSDKRASEDKTPIKGRTHISPFLPRYLDSVQHWCAPWFMGLVNSLTVKRSNELVGFAPNLEYIELQAFPGMLSILASIIPVTVSFTLFVLPPVRWLLFATGVLPRPGSGPSRQTMARGFIDFRTTAYDDQGHKLGLRMVGAGDLGCILTAIFQGESAACLAKNHASLALKGAGLTPVAVLGAHELAKRLRESGRILIE